MKDPNNPLEKFVSCDFTEPKMRVFRRNCKVHLFQLFMMIIVLHVLRLIIENLEANRTGISGNVSKSEGHGDKRAAVARKRSKFINNNLKAKVPIFINDTHDINLINDSLENKDSEHPQRYKGSRDPSCDSTIVSHRIDPATIIVPFCDEPLEVLLEVLRSIKDNTWRKMIYEIIFVKGNCKGSLPMTEIEVALHKEYDDSLVLVRAGSRRGIIEGRRKAPWYTTADQIVFLDVKARLTPDWLRPLLEILTFSSTTIAAPMVEIMDPKTGTYHVPHNGSVTVFDWHLRSRTVPLPEDSRDELPNPFKSPVVPSPVFAVNKDFYLHVGAHDPAISTWGPAQLELSLKAWLCHGRILVVPCSRVLLPRPSLDIRKDYRELLGYKRVVQSWMSASQKQYVFQRRRDLLSIDAGNLGNTLEIREKMMCLDPVYYLMILELDVEKIFPLKEPPPIANGKIKSLSRSEYCVASKGKAGDLMYLTRCKEKGGMQHWSLDWRRRLKNKDDLFCWKSRDAPLLEECSTAEDVPADQIWMYDPKSGHIQDKRTKRCLTLKETSNFLIQEECQVDRENQKWKFNVKHDLVQQEEKIS